MHKTILIVDDEDDIRMLIAGILEDEGYNVIGARNSTEAYTLITAENPDLIIQDIWLQGSTDDGMEILQNVIAEHDNLPVIMISGHGTIETAVSAIKIGAYDFIEKPFKSDRLLLMIDRALENANLKKQNSDLKKRTLDHIEQLAEQIPTNIRNNLQKAAQSNSRIFITGEVGTGKTISAKFIHEQSSRAHMPFMSLNCANPNIDKLESELFGKINAQEGEPSQKGLVALVNGGTLLLDEALSLPLELQGKVLQLLQESAYYPEGSNQKIPVDIRVIATTSVNAEELMSNGSFREDLYYRLNVVPLTMPTLRERRQDIPALINNFMPLNFSDKAMMKMQSYKWPGNIKQLHNVLEWLSIMHTNTNSQIEPNDLPPELGGQKQIQAVNDDERDQNQLSEDIMDMQLREARECFERFYLLAQVNKFGGNISRTAEYIGMERSALHRKLKSLDVFSDDKQNIA